MQLSEAISLIRSTPISNKAAQKWMDLGCGSGLFTRALASLLPPGSRILAVDTDKKALKAIPATVHDVELICKRLDFVSEPLPDMTFDGFLMANSLHYVRDKKALMSKISHILSPEAIGIFIEYENIRPSPWVPFPINFDDLATILDAPVKKIGERPSIYAGSMYAATCSVFG